MKIEVNPTQDHDPRLPPAKHRELLLAPSLVRSVSRGFHQGDRSSRTHDLPCLLDVPGVRGKESKGGTQREGEEDDGVRSLSLSFPFFLCGSELRPRFPAK